MLVRDLIEDYHDWMCDLMRINLPEHRKYGRLLHELDCKEFIFSHPLDKNRDLDGYLLREEFLFDNGYDQKDIWDGPRSVLEVLVALSKRIETEITGDLGNDKIERWFWVMIKNLGLDIYTDDNYDQEEVNRILDVWLQRRFKSNGKGGLFPLKKTTQDQRDIDIWYQMQLYLDEEWTF